MKKLMCLISVVCLVFKVCGQTFSLSIATDKTTSLIFPFSIKHVDRGTKDLLVAQVKEADNILLVKAAATNFSETNLSVVTSDNSMYTFAVSYGNPEVWIHYLPNQAHISVSTYANGILDNTKVMRGVRDKRWNMLATIEGIYIKENVIYYQLQLDNQSPIDYDIDFLRFYIRDKQKSKRTATQENELTALYIAGNTKKVKGKSGNVIVVALDKFTIPDAKYFAVEVGEKNGGRHLLLKINNHNIIKAITLPDFK